MGIKGKTAGRRVYSVHVCGSRARLQGEEYIVLIMCVDQGQDCREKSIQCSCVWIKGKTAGRRVYSVHVCGSRARLQGEEYTVFMCVDQGQDCREKSIQCSCVWIKGKTAGRRVYSVHVCGEGLG